MLVADARGVTPILSLFSYAILQHLQPVPIAGVTLIRLGHGAGDCKDLSPNPLDAKKYGAEYVRANGKRIIITTGERAISIAKDKASIDVDECEWEPFNPSRKDGFIDVGHGWIEES